MAEGSLGCKVRPYLNKNKRTKEKVTKHKQMYANISEYHVELENFQESESPKPIQEEIGTLSNLKKLNKLNNIFTKITQNITYRWFRKYIL